MKTILYNPDHGPDIPQGDLLLTYLGHAVFKGRFDGRPNGSDLKRGDGAIRLLEGEATGHHHEIVFGSKRLARFRDDGLASALMAAAPVAVGSARLVKDDSLLGSLIEGGFASPDWPNRLRDLHIGFLVVDDGPVDLIHPEHDTWRLPEGVYFVGRQVESAGAEEMAVQD